MDRSFHFPVIFVRPCKLPSIHLNVYVNDIGNMSSHCCFPRTRYISLFFFPLVKTISLAIFFSLQQDCKLKDRDPKCHLFGCASAFTVYWQKHRRLQYTFTVCFSPSWIYPSTIKTLLPFSDSPNKISFSFTLWHLLALSIEANYLFLHVMYLIIQCPNTNNNINNNNQAYHVIVRYKAHRNT